MIGAAALCIIFPKATFTCIHVFFFHFLSVDIILLNTGYLTKCPDPFAI